MFEENLGTHRLAIKLERTQPQVLFEGQSFFTYILKGLNYLLIHMVFVCIHMLIAMQCYSFFDKDCSVDMIKNKIRAFLQDLKHWMTCNFLKLNESKTKVIEILSNCNF